MTGPAAPRPFHGAELAAARVRSNRLLISAAALGSIGHIAAVTVAVVAAGELLDGAALAGTANATVIIGSAIGASLLSSIMLRSSRRLGLVIGFVIAVIGALAAAAGVLGGSIVLLLAGTLLIGFGNSSNQLTRYVSADMAPTAQRARAIGLVVWAATVGAIVGPNIVPVAATLSESAGLPELVGPFLIPVVFAGGGALLLHWKLRPDPYALAEDHAREAADATGSGHRMSELLRRPRVVVAITAMIVGQVVMVVIMAMTPLHMTSQGHGLAAVGFVISGHTAGMFAFSPVTAWIAARVGYVNTILLGVAVLVVASIMAAVAPADGGAILFVALFLLGYGWNLGFVAGSALLTTGVEAGDRTRTEGFADTLIWGSSAAASLAAGVVLAAAGFSALGIIALVMLVLPVWAIVATRGRLRASSPVGA